MGTPVDTAVLPLAHSFQQKSQDWGFEQSGYLGAEKTQQAQKAQQSPAHLPQTDFATLKMQLVHDS